MSDTRRAFQKLADALRATKASRQTDLRQRVHPLEPLDDVVTADSVAQQIVAAARTRDEGGPPLPAPDGAALAIIEAGKRRRGEL